MSLQSIRRIVTTHATDGRSVFASDESLNAVPVSSGEARFALIWTTAEVPADNVEDEEGATREAGLTLEGGSVIRIVDFLPGARSPLHRSLSIDYGLVLQGRVDLQLDSGDIKHLSAGDIVVQRGTSHLWINPSNTESARMAFVLIEAKPVVIGGKTLDDHLF